MKPIPEVEDAMRPLAGKGLGSAVWNPVYESVAALIEAGGRRTAERLVAAIVTILARKRAPRP